MVSLFLFKLVSHLRFILHPPSDAFISGLLNTSPAPRGTVVFPKRVSHVRSILRPPTDAFASGLLKTSPAPRGIVFFVGTCFAFSLHTAPPFGRSCKWAAENFARTARYHLFYPNAFRIFASCCVLLSTHLPAGCRKLRPLREVSFFLSRLVSHFRFILHPPSGTCPSSLLKSPPAP